MSPNYMVVFVGWIQSHQAQNHYTDCKHIPTDQTATRWYYCKRIESNEFRPFFQIKKALASARVATQAHILKYMFRPTTSPLQHQWQIQNNERRGECTHQPRAGASGSVCGVSEVWNWTGKAAPRRFRRRPQRQMYRFRRINAKRRGFRSSASRWRGHGIGDDESRDLGEQRWRLADGRWCPGEAAARWLRVPGQIRGSCEIFRPSQWIPLPVHFFDFLGSRLSIANLTYNVRKMGKFN
jgi:hypothetical protein